MSTISDLYSDDNSSIYTDCSHPECLVIGSTPDNGKTNGVEAFIDSIDNNVYISIDFDSDAYRELERHFKSLLPTGNSIEIKATCYHCGKELNVKYVSGESHICKGCAEILFRNNFGDNPIAVNINMGEKK